VSTIQTKSTAVARVSRPYGLYSKASVWLPVVEKSDFLEALHVMMTLFRTPGHD